MRSNWNVKHWRKEKEKEWGNMNGLCISFTWCLRRRRDGIWLKIVFHRHHLGTISQIVYRHNWDKWNKEEKKKYIVQITIYSTRHPMYHLRFCDTLFEVCDYRWDHLKKKKDNGWKKILNCASDSSPPKVRTRCRERNRETDGNVPKIEYQSSRVKSKGSARKNARASPR